MNNDQFFRDYIKMDGPLHIPSNRIGRFADGTPRPNVLGIRTPGKTPKKTPDLTKTPGGKTPSKQLTLPNPVRRPSHRTPSKTPNKGLKLTHQDRFIPSRSATDIDRASFLVTKTDDDDDDGEPSDYEKFLADAMNVNCNTKESKILSYQAAKPKPVEGYLNNLKVVYSQQAKRRGPNVTARPIPGVPERILDAPELKDDYYLNLMDWSTKNQIAVGLGNSVYLWNAESGRIDHLMAMESEEEYVSSVKWIPEGNYLAVGNSEGAVELWDVEQKKLLRTMRGHASRVGALSWNSYICSSGSRSGSIHHHDVRIAEHQVAVLTGHTQEVCGLSWSPDGTHLASGGNDNVVHIWTRELGQDVPPQQTHTYHQAAVKALTWCPWQPNMLATGGGTADRHIRLWDVNYATMIQGKDTGSQVSALLFSKEHKELISGHGYSQNQLTIWKYPNFQNLKDLLGHRERVLCMSMSPDGSMVASAAADQTIRIWKCFESTKKEKPAPVKSAKGVSTIMKPSLIR